MREEDHYGNAAAFATSIAYYDGGGAMIPRYSSLLLARRTLLREAAALVAATLLAACSTPATTGTPTPTLPPPPTPTAGTGGVPSPGASATPVRPTPPPTEQTSSAAPQPAAAGSYLLRLLAFVPLEKPDRIFSLAFANVAAAKQRYGLASVRSDADLQAHNISLADYVNATAGCYLSDFTGGSYSANGLYRDAFGYDVYQVDREIWAGQPPDYFSHMEGGFDPDAIAAKLRAQGYTTATHNGATFFTVREDNQLPPLSEPNAPLTLARLNRIAVSTERIIAAPATGLIAAALDAEAKKRPALETFPTTRALATALGDVTSMATMPPPAADPAIALLNPERSVAITAMTRDWGTLHTPELTAMGYTDAGNDKRTIHVALVYTRPADAAADAPELVKRLRGYQSIRTQQPLIPTFATTVTSRTMTVSGKGVLIADITQTPEPARGRLWLQMLTGRDTLFLVPTPLAANGTPLPIISLPGSPGTTVTPRP